MRNEGGLLRVKEERNIVHIVKRRELKGLFTFGVGTAFWNTLLKERI